MVFKANLQNKIFSVILLISPYSSLLAGRQELAGRALPLFNMFYVYVLKSLKDNNLYIGISENPEKRLRQHNLGMTKSTKSRRPFKIIYKEVYKDREEARKREKYLKSGFGREFIKARMPL